MAPTSKPQLPKEFLDKLLAEPMMSDCNSAIFDANFHQVRLAVSNGKCSPDMIRLPHNMLHTAVLGYDPPLLYEALRLGVNVNIRDDKGQTALVLALTILKSSKIILTPGNPLLSLMFGRDVSKTQQRTRAICRVLIEQHVDVNAAPHGHDVPIDLACAAQEWEIVELLLAHGTRSSPVPPMLSHSDAQRFRDLAASVSGKPRPPRVCPCWSGSLLRDCHAAGEQPYPPEFLCSCGSGKVHRKCCAGRNMHFSQHWDEKEQWIGTSQVCDITVQTGSTPIGEEAREVLENPLFADRLLKTLQGTDVAAVHQYLVERTANSLIRQGTMDPGFHYALMQVKRFPCPQGRMWSKIDCIVARDQWNAVVDLYIERSSDRRPRIEIERAAKIGVSLGALYRFCKGGDCGKLEGREVEKLSVCSKCKIAVYCGAQCQRRDWPAHKRVCNSGTQQEQMLPSQTAYINALPAAARMEVEVNAAL